MQKNGHTKHPISCRLATISLFGIWAVATIVRFILALYTSETPSIMPDEALYPQLSGSLFRDGALLFHGQPIRYAYFVYPLLLAPLHLLPISINFFRAVQLLNCIIMNMAVFPAYALGHKITGRRQTALLIALLSVVVPDMIMVNHVMTESLAYPLILVVFYLVYSLLSRQQKPVTAIGCGALCAVLYYTKPGYIAIAIAILLFFVFCSIKKETRGKLITGAFFALGFSTVFAIGQLLLHTVWQIDGGQTGLYATQASAFSLDLILKMCSGLLVYAIYVPVAFVLLPLLLPVANHKKFTWQKRSFVLILLVALVFMIIGTVYIVYVNEMGTDPLTTRIHTRYIAPFLVLFFTLCMAPELRGLRLNFPLVLGLSFSIGGLFLLERHDLLGSQQFPIDALLLSNVFIKNAQLNGRIFLSMGLFVFALCFGWGLIKSGYTKKLRKVLCIFSVVVLLLHNVAGYQLNQNSMEKTYTSDAFGARQLAGENTLFVALDGGFFWQASAALDTAYRGDIPIVEVDDIVTNTTDQGVLQNFTPRDYWHSRSVNPITIPENIIMDIDVLERITLSDAVISEYTDDVHYVVITPTQGQPWLRCALSGFSKQIIGETSRFVVYDPDILQEGSITVKFKVCSDSTSDTLQIKSGLKTYSFQIGKNEQWIEQTFPIYNPNEPFVLDFMQGNSNIYVKAYSI